MILVLILRLRQLCCFPPLIYTMLDQDLLNTEENNNDSRDDGNDEGVEDTK